MFGFGKKSTQDELLDQYYKEVNSLMQKLARDKGVIGITAQSLSGVESMIDSRGYMSADGMVSFDEAIKFLRLNLDWLRAVDDYVVATSLPFKLLDQHNLSLLKIVKKQAVSAGKTCQQIIDQIDECPEEMKSMLRDKALPQTLCKLDFLISMIERVHQFGEEK